MLPVVAGIKTTKINIFVYALILFFISLVPVFFGYFGLTYFLFSFLLGSYYVYLCYKLLTDINNDTKNLQKKYFLYSILYLFLIFSIILIDNII